MELREIWVSRFCSLGKGGLVGNGESARIWQLKRVGSELYVSLESLYYQDAELVVGKLETEDLLSWPRTRGLQPLLARRIVSEPSGRQGDLQLYLAGSDRLLESLTTWQTSFPFPNARALHVREAEVVDGVCTASDATCTSDEDCFGNGALCEGRLGPYVADVVQFEDRNQPTLSPIGLDTRVLRSTATIFDEKPGCIPVPEACDGRDQDCDGRQDDGVCCHVAQGRNDLGSTGRRGHQLRSLCSRTWVMSLHIWWFIGLSKAWYAMAWIYRYLERSRKRDLFRYDRQL